MSLVLLGYPVIVKELEDIASQSRVGRPLKAWLAIKFKFKQHLISRSQLNRKSASRQHGRLLRRQKIILNMGSKTPIQRLKFDKCNIKLDALTEWESFQYASSALSKDHVLGEQSSKYFYAWLKNSRFSSIKALKTRERLVESNPQSRWNVAQEFYKELFCVKPSDPTARSQILDLVTNKISKKSAEKLVNLFTTKKLMRAINNLLNGRAEGVNVLMIKLYKKLIDKGQRGRKFLTTLLAALNDVRTKKKLPIDLIRCYTYILYTYKWIPKKNPRDLKGYRPLFLLNVDYKLYSIILMHRLVDAVNPVIRDH